MQHFNPAVDALTDLYDRGLLVPTKDFGVKKQPDGRLLLSLKRQLKAAAPAPTGCVHPIYEELPDEVFDFITLNDPIPGNGPWRGVGGAVATNYDDFLTVIPNDRVRYLRCCCWRLIHFCGPDDAYFYQAGDPNNDGSDEDYINLVLDNLPVPIEPGEEVFYVIYFFCYRSFDSGTWTGHMFGMSYYAIFKVDV